MKILVVDGTPGAAENLAKSLTALGWPATGSAATSDDAVEWINNHGGCDVLVTEVYLQPADGLTLRDTIQPHLPDMKTIFISAHDVSALAARIAPNEFLTSPVDPAVLDSLIRKITAAPPQADTPAASPKPAPAATPTPRAVAAAPAPAATPTPRAVAAAPAPAATPTPRAVAAAPKVRAVAAAPKAPQVAAARPSAAPRAVAAAPKPAAAAAPGLEIELPPDDFVGTTVGNYQIEARIGKGPMGPIYRAKQTNINRRVRFYLLDRASSSDPQVVEKFLSNASAKARATNPVIIGLYEAGEEEGLFFYSCEYIPSRSITQLHESGGTLDEATALSAIKAAAEALDFFAREKIPHDLITANSLLIGPGNRVRMANIAAITTTQEFDLATEMRRVGEIILSALAPGESEKARDLATMLVEPGGQPTSWAAFLQTIAAYQPKTVIADAYKLDAQERAAIRAVEISKKRQRRAMMLNTLVSLVLLAAALGAIYFVFFRTKSSNVRELDKMLLVPAGEFIYQDGQKVNLPAFYIDQNEVTIGEYAKFLDYLAAHPEEAEKFSHPDQPKGKSHVPVGWADMKELTPPMPGYYTRAKKWGRYQEAALDVNSPVFGVDWFDAFAYAKWKGRRLPTEQEWEKAARGTDGRTFSWGNNKSDSLANTGQDLDPNPKKGGDKDGFKRWNTVDAKKGDKSPYGMLGASGNVSEWTATIVDSPEAGGKVPVIRGGNWKNPDPSVTRRVLKLMDLQQDDALGFRTASDTPPST